MFGGHITCDRIFFGKDARHLNRDGKARLGRVLDYDVRLELRRTQVEEGVAFGLDRSGQHTWISETHPSGKIARPISTQAGCNEEVGGMRRSGVGRAARGCGR